MAVIINAIGKISTLMSRSELFIKAEADSHYKNLTLYSNYVKRSYHNLKRHERHHTSKNNNSNGFHTSFPLCGLRYYSQPKYLPLGNYKDFSFSL